MQTYGVELEIPISHTTALQALTDAGITAHFEGYNHSTRAHWKIVTDGSLSGPACEVVSPPLAGEQGLAEIRRVCDALQAHLPARSGWRQCGLHVHLGARNWGFDKIKAFFMAYQAHEAEIDRIMAPSRRAASCNWARSLQGYNFTSCRSLPDLLAVLSHRSGRSYTLRHFSAMDSGRYHKVNAFSYLRHETIEIRQHGGTADAEKITMWVRFLVAFAGLAEDVAGSTSPQTIVTRARRNDRDPRRPFCALRDMLEASGLAVEHTGGRYWALMQGNARLQTVTSRQLQGLHSGRGQVNAALVREWLAGYGVTLADADTADTPATTATVASIPPLWQAVPAEVTTYYETRRAALGTA